MRGISVWISPRITFRIVISSHDAVRLIQIPIRTKNNTKFLIEYSFKSCVVEDVINPRFNLFYVCNFIEKK